MEKVILDDKFRQIADYWDPHIAGELNGQHVKLAKLKGAFVWHHHEHEDELFLVVKGKLTMELRDRKVVIGEKEFFIVPKGTEHRPVADEEVWVVLFEPAGTLNTGNVQHELTKPNLNTI